MRLFHGGARHALYHAGYQGEPPCHPAPAQSEQEGFMADSFKIDFQPHGKVESGDLIVFVGDNLKPAPAVAKQIGSKAVDLIARAAAAESFKGKAKSAMTIVVPNGLAVDRLIVIGLGGEKD